MNEIPCICPAEERFKYMEDQRSYVLNLGSGRKTEEDPILFSAFLFAKVHTTFRT